MKNKGNSALPDVRLAKVFNFTSEDLAANRLGFITSAQQFNAPIWQRKLFGTLGRYVRFGSARQRVEVGMCCGRAKLIETRYGNYNIVRQFKLKIKDFDFGLSEEQFRVLRHNYFYTVYFDKDNERIVAMERVENEC